MGKLSTFISKFKKSTNKAEEKPKTPSSVLKESKKEINYNFKDIFYVCQKEKSADGIPTISVVPYALSGEWDLINLETGKKVNYAPHTNFASFEDEKELKQMSGYKTNQQMREGEVKRMLSEKYGYVLTSSEAILSNMRNSTSDPYKIKQNNPKFDSLTPEEQLIETQKNVYLTQLPKNVILKQGQKLASVLTRSEIAKEKQEAEQKLASLQALKAELENLNKKPTKSKPDIIIADILNTNTPQPVKKPVKKSTKVETDENAK
ncbi:MAG: hypothetical protein IJT25_01435 [Clostridia bacterium]|nr:hypothetical protein [Clostridia bacterium]